MALGFSFLGDAAPDLASADSSFIVMVGFFLLAQVAYVVAFLPLWRRSVAGRAPLVMIPYAAVLGGLVAACQARAGSLVVPLIGYGMALTAMAVLSTGLGRWGGLGGALFHCSDALIALGEFTQLRLPAAGFWVMLTYVAGQTLIVVAALQNEAVLQNEHVGRSR